MYDTTYQSSAASSGVSGGVLVLYLALLVVAVVGMWKIFTKAGQAGWKSIIPFYNLYIMLKISGMSAWWILAFFVPFVNLVASILFALNLAKSFGRSALFGIFGLFLFNIIGYLILGFGKSMYVGPGGSATPVAPAPSAPVAPTV